MTAPLTLLRAVVLTVLCVLTVYYSAKVLSRLRKSTVVAGRLFLAGRRVKAAGLMITAALLSVNIFTATLLLEDPFIREVGRVFADISLLLFFLTLYTVYGVIKRV
ncbi:MAG: hypothetical protein DRN65_06085 [Thaumarchaeota archaeon]|nr:MAG: hypothetical protein DRN47_05255 [Candidatus Wolframiiraptor sp.]RLG06005.1 MAG: hypothetical protein DRN65_06085 [Nitrososphaerota archaeon]HDD40572.1 hypothetical protein [Nitrososphaeria archaeon]